MIDNRAAPDTQMLDEDSSSDLSDEDGAMSEEDEFPGLETDPSVIAAFNDPQGPKEASWYDEFEEYEGGRTTWRTKSKPDFRHSQKFVLGQHSQKFVLGQYGRYEHPAEANPMEDESPIGFRAPT